MAGHIKVNIYRNNQFAQQITLQAYCFPYLSCYADLRGFNNVTAIEIHSINDVNGLGFDDFSFALGGTAPTPIPTPTPNQQPVGSLDEVRETGVAVGWTRDPDNLNVANVVHFYIDGQIGTGAYIGQARADVPRADVGNHGFEFSIPAQYRDGRPHALYAYGVDLIPGNPITLLTGSPKSFNIRPTVQTVVFEPVTDEFIEQQLARSEIDESTSFEGQRIFPDKKSPEDNVSRKWVRVKSTISPAIRDVRVYFKNFDVDDPSSDINIDDTGNNGNDNREGRIIGQPYPASAAGTLSAPSALTDANGIAFVYFSVTKQPGDNFVVSASADETYSIGIVINGTGLKDSTNNPLPTTKAKRTKLLTVWRKLHMEIDSMGMVENNFITGFIRTKGEDVSTTAKAVEFHPSKGLLEPNSYEETKTGGTRLSFGGRMVVAGLNSLQVLDNTHISPSQGMPGGQRITVQSLSGSVFLRPNHPFKLFDDDDFNDSDGDDKDGDNGEDVELLNDTLSHMQTSNNVEQNAYAAAYIMPEYEWARERGINNSNVPFLLNSPCSINDCAAERLHINENRSSQALESDDFWIAYLLVSYQGDESSDVDSTGFIGGFAPNRNSNIRGNTDYYDPSLGVAPGGIGAVIFVEAIRDYALKPLPPSLPGERSITLARTRTAPHEVGHQFGLDHNSLREDGGIMSYVGDLRFTYNHINLMRWRIKSPGEGE